MVVYFSTLADISRVPLYLYDLPVRTGVALEMSTYERLASHPNIRGAKISGRLEIARELIHRLDDSFRIIVAEPQIMCDLIREGISNHLDGIFAVGPHWFMELARAADTQDWSQATHIQSRANQLLELLRSSPSVFGAFTAMMNARGIPGNFHASPARTLGEPEKKKLLENDLLKQLVGGKMAFS